MNGLNTSASRMAAVGLCVWVVGYLGLCGCTRESLRLALEAQRRADEVQQTVFDRQHEGLCILLYRDLVRRLGRTGPELTAVQREALNEVWNDRDLIEFWALQFERARALRLTGVDAKLAADQSMVDLMIKALEARADRVEEGLAANVAEQAAAAGRHDRR